MTKLIYINEQLEIPLNELQFKFTRSGGKGGQHVNKVETRVELLFDVFRSPSLTGRQRELIQKNLTSRIDAGGVLRIISQESRSQWKNRELAIKRFTELMRKTLKPKKKRIATKIPAAIKESRLENKKRRSKTKKQRKLVEDFFL